MPSLWRVADRRRRNRGSLTAPVSLQQQLPQALTRRIAANFAKLPELSCVPLKSTRGAVKSTVADLQHKSFWPGRHRFACRHTIRRDDLMPPSGWGKPGAEARTREGRLGRRPSCLMAERPGVSGDGVAAQRAPTLRPYRSTAIMPWYREVALTYQEHAVSPSAACLCAGPGEDSSRIRMRD